MNIRNPFLLLVFLTSFNQVIAQENPARLIVRADDMGYTHSGNKALIQSYKEGIATSIEVIVPAPWFPEAVKMLKENPGVDVGIHLALTSEWENIKWRPLSDCPSLKDDDGYFFPMVHPHKAYPGQSIMENDWEIADVEKEFRAQIEMGLKHIPRISHLSSHMGCSGISAEVRELTRGLAKEYGLEIDPGPGGLKTMVGFGTEAVTLDEKVAYFISMLDDLEPGQTYVFIEHPGLDNEELQAVSHVGYEDVATDRQDVTDVFTHEKVKAFIKEKRIRLISYADLHKR